ncbi:MAG: histidine kinase [Acidobacteriota bacterium]
MSVGKRSWQMPLALAVGWFLLAASNGLAWITKVEEADVSYIVRWEAVNNVIGFSVSVLLFLAYAGMQRRLSGRGLIAAAIPLCYGGGMLWRFMTALTMWPLGLNKTFEPDFGMVFIRGGLVDGTTLGLISLLYFAFGHWRQAAEQREKARHATALAHQARLQMLRYQLNPHFLFNALNSIRGMIVEDPDRSRTMVTELADFLRYSLDAEDQETDIGDEIQAVENYLAIQRIRFEEALDARVEVDPSARSVTVPSFLIHPLVENAVKYGMRTSKMPLHVRVEVARDSDEIAIRVSNTGRLFDGKGDHGLGRLPEGTGTGLKNIGERLKLVFPNRHSFGIRESEGWVHAEIRLRLSSEDNGNETAHRSDRR